MDYLGDHLLESAAPADPFELFERWLADAFAARDQGLLAEPTAMVVATCADGRPSARTVLLKGVSAGGFTFFTNYDSRKGAEIADNPAVALHFGWYAVHRQVRIEGTAAPVTREESEAYFASRPRGSQLGAWASAQSSVVSAIGDLTTAYADAEARFAGQEVPCPEQLGRLPGDPDSDRVLAGPAQPDARPPGLPAYPGRLDPRPPRPLSATAHLSRRERTQRSILALHSGSNRSSAQGTDAAFDSDRDSRESQAEAIRPWVWMRARLKRWAASAQLVTFHQALT